MSKDAIYRRVLILVLVPAAIVAPALVVAIVVLAAWDVASQYADSSKELKHVLERQATLEAQNKEQKDLTMKLIDEISKHKFNLVGIKK